MMSQQFDAIYDHGILRPLAPLALPEQARVKITVDTQLGNGETDQIAGRNGADFDAELDALLFEGPSLPPDFSRADIYADHD